APGQKILLLDDLLATGGTVLAAAELVRGLGATVQSALFVIELGFLPGRQRLEAAGVPVESLLCYTGEED
ncbi:MAG: adenine phosphoribosyltransferase, partial [Candidatus Cloacimonetes bacterium]|nr:adenine phosphoribosyltransferase [Candidatus Cloacimonadota bacterium]